MRPSQPEEGLAVYPCMSGRGALTLTLTDHLLAGAEEEAGLVLQESALHTIQVQHFKEHSYEYNFVQVAYS